MAQATPPRRTTRRSTLYFFGALGGILFGYDTAVISGVLPFMTKHGHMTGVQQGVMTASISIGSIVGALASTRVNERFGRRRTIMAGAAVAIVGIAWATFSTDFGMLTAARLVLGAGVGLCASTVPSYLSELAPARRRGAIGSLNQLFIVLGDLLAFATSHVSYAVVVYSVEERTHR